MKNKYLFQKYIRKRESSFNAKIRGRFVREYIFRC